MPKNSYPVAQVWEDGLRTDPNKQSFEWWYFDANLDDGSTIVLTFFTKQPSHSKGPLDPSIQIVYTTPSGQKQNFNQNFPPASFKASKEKCDVEMGPNKVEGDLKKYQIHLDMTNISGQLEFDRIAPSYSTSQTKESSKPEYFGWFPAIPYGTVKGELTINGKQTKFKGTGYHDHNWGIIDLKNVCQYWYWGRGKADDYYIIYTVMILPKILGGKHASILYLAKGDKTLLIDSNHLDVTKIDINPPTPKKGHLPKSLTLSYNQGEDSVIINLSNPKMIEYSDPTQGEPKWKAFLTHLFSNPLYVRYNADLELDLTLDGKKIAKKGNSLYEIMILH